MMFKRPFNIGKRGRRTGWVRLMIVVVVSMILGLSACGAEDNSTGGGLSTNPEPQTPQPPRPPAPARPSSALTETRLFFREEPGGLWWVDPAGPTVPDLIEAGPIRGPRPIFDGTLDPANNRLDDYHLRAVVYSKDDGSGKGNIYRVSALKRDSPAPFQISNEAEAGALCGVPAVASDLAENENSRYLYTLPGPDGSCTTADDILKLVRIGMTATEAPIRIPPNLTPLIHLVGPDTGAITGWLAVDTQNNTKLVRCDANLQNCSCDPNPQECNREIAAFTTSVAVLGQNFLRDRMVLRVDDTIYSYHTAGEGTRSAPLYTIRGTVADLSWDFDATDVYLSDGRVLWKVPFDGNDGEDTSFLMQENGVISNVKLTANKVVYFVPLGTAEMTLRAADKQGGTSRILLQTETESLSFATSESDWVYYERSTSGTGAASHFGSIRDDGTGKNEVDDAKLLGATFSTVLEESFRFQVERIVWEEGCAALPCQQAILKSKDAETNTDEMTLGPVPGDVSAFPFLRGFPVALLEGEKGLGVSTDIFFMKADEPNSLVRVTNTPGLKERLIQPTPIE